MGLSLRGAILWLHGFCLLIMIAVAMALLNASLPAASLVYPACVVFGVQVVWMLWSWKKIANSLLDPYALFLITAIAFNGGHALLEIFGLNVRAMLGGMFSDETLLATIIMVMCGLGSLHFGALVGCLMGIRPHRRSHQIEVERRYLQRIRITGWLLLCVSIVPAALRLWDALQVVLAYGYFALYQREVSTGLGSSVAILAAFIVPATFLLLVGSKGKGAAAMMSLVVLAIYCTSLLFLGSRGNAVMPLVACAWLWHRCVRPLPKTALVAAASVLLIVVFPVVAVTRNISGSERLSFQVLQDAFNSLELPLVAALSEMGGSMRTIAHTWELVPIDRGFEYGMGYLYTLSTVLPNLFWDIHPHIERGTASSWLVHTVEPAFARSGGGLGFSFIAEAYLNFGWLGVTLGVFLLGLACVRLLAWAERSQDPARFAVVASFLPFLLFFARAESDFIFRPLLWYSIGPYLLVRFLPRLSLKPTVARVPVGQSTRDTGPAPEPANAAAGYA